MLVQDIESAKYDGMPRSAIATGLDDYVLPPEKMPERLLNHTRSVTAGIFYATFRIAKEETEGRLIYKLGNRQWDIPALRKLLDDILNKNTTFNDFGVEHDFQSIGHKKMLLNARRIYHEEAKTQTILLAIEDITGKGR